MSRREQVRAVVLAALLVASSLSVAGVGAADSGSTETFHVTQGESCYEVEPVGSGDQTVEEFYDYRAGPGTLYGSYGEGSQEIQENQVSHLFVHRGSEGLSLVMLHDDLNHSEGGAITFDIGGLPEDREWAVEDDDYRNDTDDNFDHDGTQSTIDWMWSSNRTDGAAVRGLGQDFEAITIDPAFGEESWAHEERDPEWPYSTDEITDWEVESGSGETFSLDKDRQVSIGKGGCPDTTDPEAALSAPGTAANGEEVTFDASESTDSETDIVEYRWDFDGDGDVDETTESATVGHAYDDPDTYEASVTVEDEGGNTDVANATVEVTESDDGDDGDDGADTDLDAAFSVSEDTVANDEEVTFDASESSGDIEDYEWDFGDDESASGEEVAHTYAEPDEYEATLTVRDGAGNTDTATETVTVEESSAEQDIEFVNATAVEVNEDYEAVEFKTEFFTTGGYGTSVYRYEDVSAGTVLTPPDDDGGVNGSMIRDVVGDENASDTETDFSAKHPNYDHHFEQITPEPVTVSFEEATRTDDATYEATFSYRNPNDETLGIAASEFATGNVEADPPTEFEPGEHEFSVEWTPESDDERVTWELDRFAFNYSATSASSPPASEVGDSDGSPTARIEAPDWAFQNEGAQFDGGNSTDDGEIVSYEWEFSDGGNATGESVDYYFDGTGTHTATLTVADDDGNTDSEAVEIEIREEDFDSPNASLTASPTTVEAGDTVEFDASDSTDENGVESYEWDFDGDGQYDRTTESATTTHEYTESGNYEATVRVQDGGDKGLTDTASVDVTVEEPANEPPTADFSVSEETVANDQTVTFDASASTDDGGIEEYRWNFGDGTEKTGEMVTHSYAEPDDYEVALTVEDAAGNTDTATETVTVEESSSEPPEGEDPAAELSLTKSTTDFGQKVGFDASASTDDEGIVEYRWDFDGDGDVDRTTPGENASESADPAVVWHEVASVYDEPGTYDATVTVVDADGNTDAARATLAVEKRDDTPPTATIDAPETVTVGEEFTVKATDFSERDLAHVCWKFDGGEVDGETATVSFEETGERTITLVLKDDAGNVNKLTRTVDVEGSATPDDPSDDDSSDDPPEEGIDDDPNEGTTGGSVPSADPGGSSNDGPNDDRTEATAALDAADGRVGEFVLRSSASDDLAVEATADAPDEVREPTADRDGFAALSYATVSGADSAEATFNVSTDRLDETDADAEDVSLFRFDDGTWSAVETELLNETDDAVEFRADAEPGTYAVGLDRPSTAVEDLSVDDSRVEPGDAATVVVTVANDGRASGTHEVDLTAEGEVVATETVSVPADETREVEFAPEFDDSGIYEVSAGDASAELVVEGVETTETETTETETGTETTDGGADVPGFGVGAALAALAAAALLARRLN